MWIALCVALLSVSLISPCAGARTWYVTPDGLGDAPTIQAAFDSSAAFDTVLVAPGTFHESDILAKSYVYLFSELGPEVTTIDASAGEHAILGEDMHAPYGIDGFTVTGGGDGGGIALRGGGHQTISHCVINGCSVGIYTWQFHGTIENVTVVNSTGAGGSSGAGFSFSRSEPEVRCCISAFNAGFGMVSWTYWSCPTITCCCVHANGDGNYGEELNDLTGYGGNIDEDPRFCDRFGGNLQLAEDSPCAPFTPPNPQCDLIGALGIGCVITIVEPDGSGDYATIQEAIDAVPEGRIIQLGAGTFRGAGNRDLDFRGKALHLTGGWYDLAATVIDCEGLGRGFRFHSGEDASSILTGIMVINGLAEEGGAVVCEDASPSLNYCTLSSNAATARGGALAAMGLSAPILRFCTLADNDAPAGSGIAACDGADVTLEDCILAFGLTGEAVVCTGAGSATLSCSDVFANEGGDWVGCIADQSGVDGNFSADPDFCRELDPTIIYSVTNRSPCLPENNEWCDQVGAWGRGCEGTLHVNAEGTGDFPTIQAAINAAITGEVVELADGIFTGYGNREIDFLGKAITVRSASGDPQSCVVDCQELGRGFIFQSGEGSGSALEGVTVTRGSSYYGGALRIVDGSAPRIRGCRFADNTGHLGGVVYCHDADPVWENCGFEDNTAELGGALLCQSGARPDLRYCTLARNSAASEGGALLSRYNAFVDLRNCTLVENTAELGAAILCETQYCPVLENCIIAFNEPSEAIHCRDCSPPTLTCCDIFGNPGGDWTDCIADQYGVNGNISEDPLFCADQYPDEPWRLRHASPCAPFSPPNPECDLIGAWDVGCGPMGTPDGPLASGQLYLAPSRPNPFRTPVRIAFEIPEGGANKDRQQVALRVYDASGRLVRTLVERERTPGKHEIIWDGRDATGRSVTAGVYFCQLECGGEMRSRRIVVIR